VFKILDQQSGFTCKFADSCLEIDQGLAEHVLMPGISGLGKLLQDLSSGEVQPFNLLLASYLLGGKSRPRD
jgi:hypothetical protein